MASPRSDIARVAAAAALSCAGVAALLDGGGRWTTDDGNEPVEGVVVAASDMGLYSVDVHICAFPTQLMELASEVRLRIHDEARGAGLSEAISEIAISIDGYVDPDAGAAA